jgi:hypothetical protein
MLKVGFKYSAVSIEKSRYFTLSKLSFASDAMFSEILLLKAPIPWSNLLINFF